MQINGVRWIFQLLGTDYSRFRLMFQG